MDEASIRALVKALDTSSVAAEDETWMQLRPLGIAVVPFLAEFYPHARTWQGRCSLVFHSMRYCRESQIAYQLGLTALRDKSWVVRHWACALCAYALRKDALAALEALFTHRDPRTVDSAKAAADAIQHNNHHYFKDRTHSGVIHWDY